MYTFLFKIAGNKRVKNKWLFSFSLVLLVLEDCRIDLGGRLVQISDIVESLSEEVRGMDYSWLERGTNIYRYVFYFMHLFFSIFTFISILKRNQTSSNTSNREKSNKPNSPPLRGRA